jgi:colicin import membrane protein
VAKTRPPIESKPQSKETKLDLAEAERQRKALADQQRRERLAALGELADDSLQRSLDAEAEQMLKGQNEQEVQSYQASIYDLVRKNWSRPPSARNGMQARFVVELIPTGEVLSVALVDSSGNGSFDRSAEQAIRRARRFDVPKDNELFEANFRRFYFLFRPEDLLR